AYGEEKAAALLADPGIIRNRLKVRASIRNSQVFLAIQAEFGSFDRYIWSFTDGRVIREDWTLRTASPLSDAVSADLKKRGMTFVGTTIIYSYLQAIGVLAAHSPECFCCCRETGERTE
ncbi:MAG: DNA-3-methyladenine glycosylase I, partial [Oscillibacter sp.]|nr:DNA-3-methyladenine glycosylase I [Oscillibacter sp.]